LTLKKEATKPAAANVLQQQTRFDAFVDQYNRTTASGPIRRYDLGYFDDETCRLEPIENPFAPKLMS
jgi:putative transposase